MNPAPRQSIRLFRLFGITVFLHWSWFLLAAYRMDHHGNYDSAVWSLAQYVGLFCMVVMHEFGHSLACRQVGGTTHDIVLWPFGGVAYVNPPPRPGALLWCIAAGPLVNVALIPVFIILGRISAHFAWAASQPNIAELVKQLTYYNLGLLIFNILPIYPMDGGQIFQALLWFPFGRVRSLQIAGGVGVALGGCLIGLALWSKNYWLAAIMCYIVQNSWRSFKVAKNLDVIAKLPRRDGFACPSCHARPIQAALWNCSACQQPFDTFQHGGICPNCAEAFTTTACPECRKSHPMAEWSSPLRSP